MLQPECLLRWSLHPITHIETAVPLLKHHIPITTAHWDVTEPGFTEVDLGDIQGLLGHRQIETTRKHHAPMLTSRLAKWVHTRRLGLPAEGRTRGEA